MAKLFLSSLRLIRALAVFGLAGGIALAAESGDVQLPTEVAIGVRSSVDERWQGMRKGGPIEHGKIYLIASLKQAPSAEKLVKPVDEAGLLAQLRLSLNTRGFREATNDEVPDVVLTLLYGRGHVRNPFLANIDGDVSSGSIAPTPAESSLAAAIDPRLHDKRQWGFYEQKLLAAQKEKLFIRVTAWKFPEHQKEKPAELWKTTMVVDDPHQHDLNTLYPKMLAAGVPFFDRPLKEEEVTVTTSLRQGRVDLGPLNVLEQDVPGKASEAPPGETRR